jgi:peroxiredoxin
MVLVKSLPITLGTTMPSFTLKDPKGIEFKSDDLCGSKGMLVVFTCNHCPYAIAVWPRLIKLAAHAKDFGIETIAINANIHPHFPEDSAPEMIKKIKEWGIFFPYLVDQKQAVAKSFKAQCTPDIYLFDANKSLIYHGRIDDNWHDESTVKKEELKNAIDTYASGKEITSKQNPSVGCSIKWINY